ncbi:FecR family protein [Pedobacter hiemivivus]|uniref:FecR family protein n=1 Tax=Pedobacter hiemivivus TaxID=2530454 RepID=A0A4R0N8U8_9SPHI|nr:FecR domain-containing protein [Pedobacter hiemivivus]TCC96571.1 FecR family protein [Pedobacter hiemivivus]
MAKILRPSKKALISFFKGESAPEESDLIRLYLALDTDQAFVQQCLQETWNGFQEEPQLPLGLADNETAWQKFQGRQSARFTGQFKRNFWKYPLAAAMVILCTSVAFLFYIGNKPLKRQESATNIIRYEKFRAEIAKLTILTLPDSSKVTMFPNASIELPDNFNKTDRRIKLTGKAYFQVKHDVKRPFYVHSGKLSTQVLGTSFQISTIKSGDRHTITLHTGKIAVNYGSAHLDFLVPDQQMTVFETGKFTIMKINAAQLTSWTQEQLRYDQIPLSDICSELEDWYGLRITIRKEAVRDKKLTASFKRKPLNTVLDILSMTGGFEYSIENNQVTIY